MIRAEMADVLRRKTEAERLRLRCFVTGSTVTIFYGEAQSLKQCVSELVEVTECVLACGVMLLWSLNSCSTYIRTTATVIGPR